MTFELWRIKRKAGMPHGHIKWKSCTAFRLLSTHGGDDTGAHSPNEGEL